MIDQVAHILLFRQGSAEGARRDALEPAAHVRAERGVVGGVANQVHLAGGVNGPQIAAPHVADVFGARIAASNTAIAQAWPGLEATLEARRRALGGHWEELRKVALPVNPRAPAYVSSPLPAARCLDVLVVSNEETTQLEVTLADDTGREIMRAANVGKDRTALVCSPVDTTISVAVRPHEGHGVVGVVMSRSGQGDEAELSVRPDAIRVGPMEPIDAVRTRIGGMLARAGYDPKVDIGAGALESGRSVALPINLPAGCSRMDVFAGQPLAGVRVSLWDAADTRVASAEGGEHTTVFGCVSSAQKMSLELDGIGRPGPFAVELRKEKAPPPELTFHTVAAARVLARANSAGRTISMQNLSDVRRVDFDETRRSSFDTTVAVGTCMNVVAAAQPGAAGLVLSTVDVATGTEQAQARGNHVVLLRTCSRGKAMRLRVHASAEVGRAEGVALTFVTAAD